MCLDANMRRLSRLHSWVFCLAITDLFSKRKLLLGCTRYVTITVEMNAAII